MNAIDKDTIICPHCGKVITEVIEHFSGDEIYRNVNGKFIKVPSKTIESYSIIDGNCGGKIPSTVAEKLIALMSDQP